MTGNKPNGTSHKGNMTTYNNRKVQNASNNHNRGRGSNTHTPKGGRNGHQNYYTQNNADYSQNSRDSITSTYIESV